VDNPNKERGMVSRISQLFEEAEVEDDWEDFDVFDEEEDDYEDSYAKIRDESGEITIEVPDRILIVEPLPI
jgi:hypothetical protein